MICVVQLLLLTFFLFSNPIAAKLHSLQDRQISIPNIPQACTSRCIYAGLILLNCKNGGTSACLQVCTTQNAASVLDCLQCVIDNDTGINTEQYASLQGLAGTVVGICNAAGRGISLVSSLTAPFATSSTSSIATSTIPVTTTSTTSSTSSTSPTSSSTSSPSSTSTSTTPLPTSPTSLLATTSVVVPSSTTTTSPVSTTSRASALRDSVGLLPPMGALLLSLIQHLL